MVTALLIGLATITVVMGITVAISRAVGRVSVVDVTWGLMFVAVAIAIAVWSPDWHSLLLAGLVTIWGGRLAWHIARRSRGHGEDPRYAEMLGAGGFGEAVRRVFVVQAGVAFVISLPIMVAGAYDLRWSWLVWVGAAVWLVGFGFEVVGDAQLAAYKAKPKESRPQILDTGLWGWTRHPNYFGDASVWWGLWLAGALATGWLPGLLSIVAPAAMTFFIRNVTGAKLLERTMSQRPGWAAYAERVPLFFPRPPRG